jgi:hypothetical protein
MVTRINVTVKDGKVTWLHQEGDELPNWDDVAASICNAIENNKHYHHKQN